MKLRPYQQPTCSSIQKEGQAYRKLPVAEITYITDYAQQDGYVALGIK
ncbi:hypothetical protein [Enterococcus faecalis]